MERPLPNGSVRIAQGTGDIGLLRPPAAVASARAILALAALAALLALTGCGGDSDSGSSSAPTSTQSIATAPAEEAAPSKQAQKPQGGKQGPGITLPKGKPEPTTSQGERQEATVADLTLTSSSFPSGPEGAVLSATYTCDAKNTWPSLAWKGVPTDTQELVLLVVNLAPVEGKIFFYWALAGIDPTLAEIKEGELPPGAIVGKNSFGKTEYDLCPAGDKPETFLFSLYALPEEIGPNPGFDPLQLRESILRQAGNVGLLAATYG